MKKLVIIVGFLLSSSLYHTSYAQVNVQVNIGNQPIWGPTGYNYVDYYYLPDLDIYYYVPLQQWIYFNGRSWIPTTTLPAQYRSYDLYGMHKVVINEKQPYLRNATYRKQYATFKGRNDQQAIRDSHDQRYFVNSNHPQHNQAMASGRGGQPTRNAAPQAQRNEPPNRNQGPQVQTKDRQNQPSGPQDRKMEQQRGEGGNPQGGRPGNQ